MDWPHAPTDRQRPGHEFAGFLLDAPEGMADVRYACSPAIWCGQCDYCIAGLTHLCSRGAPGIGLGRDGGVAETVDVPANNLFAVAVGIDPLVASLAEPLAVAVRGVGIGRPELQYRAF